MKLVVYKYPIPIQDEFFLELPCGAIILDVQEQRGGANIWALVDPTRDDVRKRRFRLAGTGHPIEFPQHVVVVRGAVNAPPYYIGTFQLKQGELVFHLFEMS